MGIGIDVADAFVGNIGQRALYDFTAVGDVVNTASRLSQRNLRGAMARDDV
jgi:adenylate cyclase